MCGLGDSGVLPSALVFGVLQYTVLVEVYLIGASYRHLVAKGSILTAVSGNCYYSLILHQNSTSHGVLNVRQFGIWNPVNGFFTLLNWVCWSIWPPDCIFHPGGFATSHIGHLGNAGSPRYSNLPNAGTRHDYAKYKRSHSFVSPLSSTENV